MGEIARRAGVSKGTLYVYFDSKERLFENIVEEERKEQAAKVFALDSSDHDVEAVLSRLGADVVRFLCRPELLSSLRTVISICERRPDIGRHFFESGPAIGVKTLQRYLEDQASAGVLVEADYEIAAAQFIESCQSTLFKPMLFNFAAAPSDARIAHVVGMAVRSFLAAYLRR
jgi:AcrR family transcriptional regulator